jgi:hypothetical protein
VTHNRGETQGASVFRPPIYRATRAWGPLVCVTTPSEKSIMDVWAIDTT